MKKNRNSHIEEKVQNNLYNPNNERKNKNNKKSGEKPLDVDIQQRTKEVTEDGIFHFYVYKLSAQGKKKKI